MSGEHGSVDPIQAAPFHALLHSARAQPEIDQLFELDQMSL
jgi:hypothetical protein